MACHQFGSKPFPEPWWFIVNCLPLSSSYKTTHGHWPHVNVCRVPCGGVVNMLLVLLITSYFHNNIWGRMCSTRLFQYRWLKGFIYSSCYYHHQIGIIHLSHCCHIFPWLCVWDGCLQIGPIRLQPMRTTNHQIMIQNRKMKISEKESHINGVEYVAMYD